MGEADDTTDETTFDQRIEAALALAAGSPDAGAEDVLEDRRLTLRWFGILFPIGFALFAWLVIGQTTRDGRPSGLVITLVVLGLLAAVVGGVLRWWVDRRRLAERRPDAVFTRRERQLLLGNVRSAVSAATARPSLPVLTEIVHWRLASGWADPLLTSGVGLAWITAHRAGQELPLWQLLFVVLLAVVLVVLLVRDLQSLRRYRRFLMVSAAWDTRVVAD